MRIQHKLFLALLTGFTLLILVPAGFNYWTLERGLSHYLSERAAARLKEQADDLAERYQQAGSWQQLLAHRQSRLFRGDHDEDNEHPHRPPRLTLLDSRGNRLLGPPPEDRSKLVAIVTSDGKRVGWLGWAGRPHVRDAMDRRFRRHQLQLLLVSASTALVLALLFAWLLSRHLVRPIERLSRASRRLAEGDYAVRLEPDRHDELGQLTGDINQLAHSLEAARKSRQRWLADISHELRTPVAILRGELDAILDGVRTMDRPHLEALASEIQHLQHLLDDLHSLALADAGSLRYRMENLDLAELVHQVTASMEHVIADAGLSLELNLPDTELPIQGDPQRLHQLLTNLLNNSVRYTAAPGTIRMTLERQHDTIHLRIEDSAPGVPDDAMPHLFDHLFRVEHSRSRVHGGSGLGLAICKRIAEAHQGQLTASHSTLGGLAMELTLPLELA